MSNIWIGHKEKHILYADLRRLLGAQVIANLEELAKIIREVPPPVRLLLNAEGILIGPSEMREVKQPGKIIFASKALSAAAIVVTAKKVRCPNQRVHRSQCAPLQGRNRGARLARWVEAVSRFNQ